MSVAPKTDDATAAKDIDFGGTPAAEAQKKKQPSKRLRIGGDRGWYGLPSIPKMKWLRSVEIADKDHPLGKFSCLSNEELEEEVFHCGVPLLELFDLAAGSYQLTSPWAVLGNALGTAAMDEPDALVATGMDAYAMPLNFLIAFVGVSGRGKGSALRTPLKMATDLLIPPMKTPASGEALIKMFFEKIDTGDDKKPKLEWVRRESQGVWANWDEIDAFAAKSGVTPQKGRGTTTPTTIGAHLRSLYVGGQVGDEALSRESECSYLQAGSYRFVGTIQSQPDRMGALVNDDKGGTLQRLLIFPTQREDAKPTPAEWRARKAAFCKKLGVPTAKTCPTLIVWGPHGQIEVTEEVEDLIVEGRLANAYGERDAVDGHLDSIRIRLAAIFAGWVAGFEGKPVIDVNAWWWACCVTTRAARARDWSKEQAETASENIARDLGHSDAVRRNAQDEAKENIAMKTVYPRVRERTIHLMQTIPNTTIWNSKARKLGTLATENDIAKGLSSNAQRDFLPAVMAELVSEKVAEAVQDGNTVRYRMHPNAAERHVGS